MPTSANDLIQSLNQSLSRIIYGKSVVTQQALTCLLAGGHLLLEDLPGMGKTTLAQGLAKVLGVDFQRIQFTSDLLPADVLGSSIYQQSSESFVFREGPIFTQVLLADEINRASPKTQSALLEAMGEYQVTAEGETYALPQPFFVIATQNPIHQSGTFPLPESQLDRFMMRLSLGYPTVEAERRLLTEGSTVSVLEQLKALLKPHQLKTLQECVSTIKVSESVVDYLQRLLAYTRHHDGFANGISPRGALAWLHCAKAWALVQRRSYVIPDDLQDLMVPVLGHRLLPKESLSTVVAAMDAMKQAVPVVE